MTEFKNFFITRPFSVQLFASLFLVLLMLTGCDGSTLNKPELMAEEFEMTDYTPFKEDGWKVSTPVDQGLDPLLVEKLYHNADQIETLYGLLVVKNGYLIAEDYFNEGTVEGSILLQSASKSYLSALVGIALDQGCLSDIESPIRFSASMMEGLGNMKKRPSAWWESLSILG